MDNVQELPVERAVSDEDAPATGRHRTITGVARAAASGAATAALDQVRGRRMPPWAIALILTVGMICGTIAFLWTWERPALAPVEPALAHGDSGGGDGDQSAQVRVEAPARVECDPVLVAWINQTMIWAQAEERAAIVRGDAEAEARWRERHTTEAMPLDVQNCASWYRRAGSTP